MSIENINIHNYKTPFYYYDESVIHSQIAKLKNVLPSKSILCYSLKANSNRYIINSMVNKGLKLEISTIGEFLKCKEYNKCNNIILTGPCKTYNDLLYIMKNNIYSIHLESLEELMLIDEIAKRLKIKQNIAIRINIKNIKSSTGIMLSGENTHFGVSLNDIDKILINIEKYKNIKLIGLSFFFGTQFLDYKNIIHNFNEIINTYNKIKKLKDIKFEYIDFGGGFGVSYFKNDNVLDLDSLKKEINELFENFEDEVDYYFESGRFLVAESGKFITQVKYKKNINGKQYLICDGGMSFHSSAAGIGRLIRDNFPISSYEHNTRDEKVDEEIYEIVGPSCTSLDIIGKKIKLPKVNINDYIIINKSGAYCYTYSPILFMSLNQPFEYFEDINGNIFSTRIKIEYE